MKPKRGEGETEYPCAKCGKMVLRYPSRVRGLIYCSRSCARMTTGRRAKPKIGPFTYPCDRCGKPVTREYQSDFQKFPVVYCDRKCADAHRRERGSFRRAQLRLAIEDPERAIRNGLVGETVRCRRCQQEKPYGEMIVDRSRPALRRNICRECMNAKSKAYYAANQERLKARARERKRALRANTPQAPGT